jgi:heptaprenyl diphosphate synthase
VHVRWDAKVAVLAGDYLLAKASATVASLDDPYLTRRLADIMTDLCEGELQQDEQARRLDTSLEDYLTRIEKKTASPFELACEGGARISGARGRQAAVARRFGFHFGRLFQIVDDVLDWVAETREVGKPVGRDLESGVVTLPVLVALEHPELGPLLRQALTPFPERLSDDVRALVTDARVFDLVKVRVREEAERAHQWLAEFPAGPARVQLAETVDALAARATGGAR